MNIVEAVRIALDHSSESFAINLGITPKEVYRKTEEHIKRNSKEWRSSNPNIDYANPFCRMAYIYMNVAVHANLVAQAFSTSSTIKDLLEHKIERGEEINVCALGGGPGSELLGLAKFIEEINQSNKTAYIDFLLVDYIKEWDESWHVIKKSIDEQLRASCGPDRNTWPLIISRSFLPLSAISVKDFENFSVRFREIDLFVFSYMFSEVLSSKDEFAGVIDSLATRSKNDAYFLFIDRNERIVREGVQEVIEESRYLNLLENEQQRGRLNLNLSELGEWFINIESLPRQRWMSFFALAEKLRL